MQHSENTGAVSRWVPAAGTVPELVRSQERLGVAVTPPPVGYLCRRSRCKGYPQLPPTLALHPASPSLTDPVSSPCPPPRPHATAPQAFCLGRRQLAGAAQQPTAHLPWEQSCSTHPALGCPGDPQSHPSKCSPRPRSPSRIPPRLCSSSAPTSCQHPLPTRYSLPCPPFSPPAG